MLGVHESGALSGSACSSLSGSSNCAARRVVRAAALLEPQARADEESSVRMLNEPSEDRQSFDPGRITNAVELAPDRGSAGAPSAMRSVHAAPAALDGGDSNRRSIRLGAGEIANGAIVKHAVAAPDESIGGSRARAPIQSMVVLRVSWRSDSSARARRVEFPVEWSEVLRKSVRTHLDELLSTPAFRALEENRSAVQRRIRLSCHGAAMRVVRGDR